MMHATTHGHAGESAPERHDAFWMPFTPNRQFKQAPRMLVKAEGMHYTSDDGRQILDGLSLIHI